MVIFGIVTPNSEFKIPKYKCQFKNLERDKKKEKWLNDNNYKLLRIWESDINNNIEKVKQQLTEILSKP